MQGCGVIIVGAGFGGLVTALALQHHGVPCRVFEKAPELGRATYIKKLARQNK